MSHAVFRGTVTAIADLGGPFGTRVSFAVTAVWKETLTPIGDTVDVHTPDDEASCGVHFLVGGDYIVYGWDGDEGIFTTLCTRTRPYSFREVEALGPPLRPKPLPAEFRRGDANADGQFDLSDAVYTLEYLFVGGPVPSCMKTADADDDGRLLIGDAIYFLGYLFQSRPAPPEPFTGCGNDPSADDLSCHAYGPCGA